MAVSPYFSDPNTVFLFHLDEANGSSAGNSATGSSASSLQALTVDGNPLTAGAASPLGTILGATPFPGFGSAANLSGGSDLAIAVDSTGPGGTPDGVFVASGSPNADNITLSSIMGTDSAFTVEAMVNIPNLTTTTRSIVQTDNNNANASRGFQFRINNGNIEVNSIGSFSNNGATSSQFPIPTSGPNAFVANEWFHVAMVYSNAGGSETTTLYWTRVNATTETASVLGTTTNEGVDPAWIAPLVIGNEGRNTGSGANMAEGLRGLIDEVRISNVARGPREFIFESLALVGASSSDTANGHLPANVLDSDPGTRWSSSGDGEWIAFDLGRIRLIGSVQIAFHLGDQRVSHFDIESSLDGIQWTNAAASLSSSGSSSALETHALNSPVATRFLRYVGRGNSQNMENSIVEFVVNSTSASDTDADGLPDAWEQSIIDANPADAYASLSDVTPEGDFDGDGHHHATEFAAGSDPTIAASVPGDIDGDALADSWETLHFGNLATTPAEDGDFDGFNHLAESAASSNPKNPFSVPGDTDGDQLPDLWETQEFSSLSQFGFADSDADGATHLEEFIGGSDPNDSASLPPDHLPRVGLTGSSIVGTQACIMPNNAIYGRAINGVSFQDQIIATLGAYQYTAYYNSVSGVERIVLARRTVDGFEVGPWESFQTSLEFTNGDESGAGTSWNAHNTISLGICETDGTLHLAWDHHGHTLKYCKSIPGLCTTQTSSWGSGMLLPTQNWLVAPGQTVSSVTYPQFISTPSGGLYMNWRIGGSGNGDQLFSVYQPGTGNWSSPVTFIDRAGNYQGSNSRCPYINGFDFAPDGSIHVTWTWRESAGSSNHDICYAYSSDGGLTWKNRADQTIADTSIGGEIHLNSPGIIFKPTDMNQLLINQQTQCVDGDGRVHVLMLHRREDPGYEHPNFTTAVYSTLATAYHHYYLEPGESAWRQRRIPPAPWPVGSRPSIAADASGNLYAAFTTYPEGTQVVPGYTAGRLAIAAASKASQWTDWEVLQVIDIPNRFTGEPLVDSSRLLQNGVLSVYLQQNSSSNSAGVSPLHVFDFAVDVAAPATPGTAALGFHGSDVLVSTLGLPGETYQLEWTTQLGSPWVALGQSIVGQGHLISVPHPDGASGNRHFYRFRVTPP